MPLGTLRETIVAEVWALAADVTPSPTPSGPPAELVTPGFAGFAVIAVIVIAVILLVWDMQRRIRRARYREEVGAELDAEQAALAEEAQNAVTDSSGEPDASDKPESPRA